jgi:hypothetical protein
MSGEDSKQRARRLIAVHRPDPMEAAIAAEIEGAVEYQRQTEVAPLREEVEEIREEILEEKKRTDQMKQTAGEAVSTLRLVVMRLAELKKTSLKLRPTLLNLMGVANSFQQGTSFAQATDPKTGQLFQVHTNDMVRWTADLENLLDALEALVQEPPAGERHTCDNCGKANTDDCHIQAKSGEVCSEWSPKTPAPAAKEG